MTNNVGVDQVRAMTGATPFNRGEESRGRLSGAVTNNVGSVGVVSGVSRPGGRLVMMS